jgi:hypothetical protein
MGERQYGEIMTNRSEVFFKEIIGTRRMSHISRF